MRKILVGIVLGLGLWGATRCWATTTQAHSIGLVDLAIKSQTLVQIQSTTATVVGAVAYCSTCVQSPLCVSTGTTLCTQWATVGSTTTSNPAILPCK